MARFASIVDCIVDPEFFFGTCVFMELLVLNPVRDGRWKISFGVLVIFLSVFFGFLLVPFIYLFTMIYIEVESRRASC